MKRTHAWLFTLFFSIALLGMPTGIQAQFESVGTINFPTSATGEAQQHFLRGVSILHSFGWKQAREQFHAAQALDPDFAMAYWGESLAYNHPLNSQMDPTEPRAALMRLAPTPEARLAKAPTDREKGFLRAVEILWGDGSHEERRVGYMESMRDLYEANPGDPEVAAYYALSLLSATAATGDLTMRWNTQAGAIAIRLMGANPNHPGAAHYTIHSFDSPIRAPLALDAAYAFADIAPAVSHARHMPTHIFIQHGMWDLVSGHNQSAFDAAKDLWQPGDPMGDAVHALDWGHYGDLQLGDYAKARTWMERLGSMVENEGFAPNGGSAGMGRPRGTVALLKARYIVETEKWEAQPITEDSPAHELLATGISAARQADAATMAEAEAALGRLSEGRGYPHVMHKQVGALRHAAMGHDEVAIGLMDEAVAAVVAMAPPRGSANPVKPVYELYGEMLLDLGRPAEAVEKFETSLLRMPNRARSVLGLARAHAALGHRVAATEAYERVAALWAGREAEATLEEVDVFMAQFGSLR